MIQQKQTLYLFLSLIVMIVCLCMPVTILEPQGMGLSTLAYNIGTVIPNRGINFSNWSLFVLLVVIIPSKTRIISLYCKQLLRTKLCLWSVILCLAWYIYYAFTLLNSFSHKYTYHLQLTACLSLATIIALILARQGIIHGGKLVRLADRVR